MRYRQTILGTVCVPWNEQYTFEEALFRDQIRHLIQSGLRDLYIFGTAGEGYAVGDSQFDAITRAFVEEMSTHNAQPMVGVMSLSLNTVIERIERASEMGVRAFQISLPCWGALSDKELALFFKETCGRFPGLQFLHYNLLRAKRLVTPAEYSRLARDYPNLVATKHGTADASLVSALLCEATEIRHFFTEPCFAYASLLSGGQCGFLISVASINALRARDYYEAGLKGDASQLMQMQRELVSISSALKETVGNEAHMDGAYDKIFHKLQDSRFPLHLLPPYQGVSDATCERFRAYLQQNFPQWLPQRTY